MAKYLVTNENGDWWEFDTASGNGTMLWIIETDKLREQLGEDLDGIEIYELDKLDRAIKEYGYDVSIEWGN
jgi:NADH/NAD ratio-sensing transcriptional regulator Rex